MRLVAFCCHFRRELSVSDSDGPWREPEALLKTGTEAFQMFEVGLVGQFEAAHALRGDFGPASQVHGHTYRVELVVRGNALAPDATLIDVGKLRETFSATLAQLDYKNLNELATFQEWNPTAEAIAETICQIIRHGLTGRGLQTIRVQVWESPSVYAAFETTMDGRLGR